MKSAHIVSFLHNKIPPIEWKNNMKIVHIVLFQHDKTTQILTENNMKLTQIISFYHKKTISIVKRNDFKAVNIVFFNCEKATLIPARNRRFLLRPIAAEYPLGHKLIGCLYIYMQPGQLFFRVYICGLCLHYAWHVQINGPFILSATQVALSLPYENCQTKEKSRSAFPDRS